MEIKVHEGLCPVCKGPLKARALTFCTRCWTAYHTECFRENKDRCAVFGCESSPPASVGKEQTAAAPVPSVDDRLPKTMLGTVLVVIAIVMWGALIQSGILGTLGEAPLSSSAPVSKQVVRPKPASKDIREDIRIENVMPQKIDDDPTHPRNRVARLNRHTHWLVFDVVNASQHFDITRLEVEFTFYEKGKNRVDTHTAWVVHEAVDEFNDLICSNLPAGTQKQCAITLDFHTRSESVSTRVIRVETALHK